MPITAEVVRRLGQAMIVGLLFASCSTSGVPTVASTPSSLVTAQSESIDHTISTPPVSATDLTVTALVESRLSATLAGGLSQVVTSGTEAEYFDGLADIRDRSSAVVVARILGPGPDRTIVGDVPSDVLTMMSVEIEVLEFLGGTRVVEKGEVLLMEPMLPFPELAFDTVWIMFLRNKQDGVGGLPNPGALSSEVGIWRQVNSQGLFVDSGAGRPLNPVAAAAAWASGDQSRDLEEFAMAVYDPASSNDPVAREVAAMTTAELLDFLRAESG
jgi:hypothetical protein